MKITSAIPSDYTIEHKRTSRLLFIVCLSSLSFLFFFLFIKHWPLVIFEFIFLFASIILYWLNQTYFIYSLRSIACIWASIGIFYFGLIMGTTSQTNLLYFSTIWFPLVILKKSELLQRIVCIIASILFYLTLHYVRIDLFTHYSLTGLVLNLYNLLIILCSFLVNLSFAYVLTDTVGQTKQKLKETENDLSSSKAVQVQLHDQATFGHVIQGISHELRNPMTSLKLWADLLKKTPEDTALAEKTATIFLKNIDHLSKRTDSMLKYAHVNHSKNTAMAMHTLCADIGLLFSHQAKSKCIELVIQADTPLFVYGNEHDVHSAIRNVTLNALQFTPDHGRITIDVSTERYTPMDTEPSSSNGTIDGVKLTITDTGCGIQTDQLNLIFEPFVTSKSGRSNAGLGLAEVKKIIAKQNGAIHIESKINIGTTLSIYLPQHIPSGQTQKDLV
ncbi:HAMP domain-containing histidine kinase [Candidatus Marinamargulisbacteria bacterium]|nr:HAMP domain-containing histidine kinase [Candidatus Marinamargulisbacteria bacterium]